MAEVSPRSHRVAVIPGDGTGPEVVLEGLKVLRAVSASEGFDVETVGLHLGADRYLKTGDVLPDEELQVLRQMDAIFLGALGDPRVKPGILERDLLLRIRFELDEYVNLRPVIRYPGVKTLIPSQTEADVNFVVVRENGEGLYTGAGGFHRKGTPHEVAVQESVNTRHGVERIVRYAFEYARRPDRRRKLTLVHKTNVLTYAGDLYQRVVDEVSREFPEVETDYVHVDAACIYFLDQPSRFDVIVTDNMFGDIITDLGAMLQGGLGVAAGGNINPGGVSMFEPIGGTAPNGSTPGSDSRVRSCTRCAPATWATRPPRWATWSSRGRAHEPGRPGRTVRHHPARRGTAGRPLVLDRGPAADPASAGLDGLPVRRGGLAGREPSGDRGLPAGHQGEAAARDPHRLRHDPQGRRAGRGQRGPPRPPGRRHRGRVSRGEVVGPPRHRGPADHARRGRGHGPGLDRLPCLGGAAGVLRRRALLRWVPAEPVVRHGRAGGSPGGGRRTAGAVRYERWRPASRRLPRRR